MKQILLILVLAALSSLQAQNLPHRLAESEKQILPQYLQSRQLYKNGVAQQPPQPVRTMAEWEELQGLQITWTSYYDILAQIVDYAQDEVTVYIVCSDSNQVKAYLTQRSIPLINLVFLEDSYNSVWCRDYGPWTVYENDVQKMDIVDWIYNRPRPDDDVIPVRIAAELGDDIYEAIQAPDDLVHTGGNFMVDGHNTGFSSKLILDENSDKTEAQIDDIAARYLGLDRYIKMDNLPSDEIHHIDMHMKLLDEETLLVGEYPTGVADGPQIEANLQYVLDNYNTCFNRDYQVVRIPMPPDARGHYPDNNGDYRTYTNSVIVNKTVIVPTYQEKYDTTALRIYREAMPGYRVVGIDCNDIITALGAIHCITKEIGVSNPIWISHAKLRTVTQNSSGYTVTAKVLATEGVAAVNCWWSTDTTAGFNNLTMQQAGVDSFSATIPAQVTGTRIFYYITASDELEKTTAKPLVGAAGCYEFTVQGTSPVAETAASTKSFELLQNYPNPFNPQTQIAYRLDRPQHISLTLFNSRGQKVRQLVSGFRTAGSYQEIVDGSTLAAGIYYYRLQDASGWQQVRKMLLVK